MPRHDQHFPTGLEDLLRQDPRAKQYYNTLPSYVQDLVNRSRGTIQTQAELERCAGNILEGLNG